MNKAHAESKSKCITAEQRTNFTESAFAYRTMQYTNTLKSKQINKKNIYCRDTGSKANTQTEYPLQIVKSRTK